MTPPGDDESRAEFLPPATIPRYALAGRQRGGPIPRVLLLPAVRRGATIVAAAVALEVLGALTRSRRHPETPALDAGLEISVLRYERWEVRYSGRSQRG
ncbi:MAG TPA: hypothetical protein VKX16_12635 [Chloroflexota bacterium]|nr:hypothetical protein [Chloroflexota bacterium]